jgi:hypothetical protein
VSVVVVVVTMVMMMMMMMRLTATMVTMTVMLAPPLRATTFKFEDGEYLLGLKVG